MRIFYSHTEGERKREKLSRAQITNPHLLKDFLWNDLLGRRDMKAEIFIINYL